MADLADDQHVQRTSQNPGDFGRDYHAAARQTQNEVGLNVLLDQVPAQSLSSFGARGECHSLWNSNLAYPADLAMQKEGNPSLREEQSTICSKACKDL